MTDKELLDLKAQIRESLSIDRHSLVVKFPFTGNLTMRMDLVPIRDIRVRTACTDGNKVYFDCDFYTKLKPDERIFVLAHEVWHCVMLHLVRLQSRIQAIFNIASDMEINYLLKEQGLNPPSDLCFPPKNMEGKSAEEIYEWLLKTAKENSESDNSSNGNKSGKLEGQFDNHKFDGNEEKSKSEESNGFGITDQWGEVGLDKDFNPQIDADFSEKMREAVLAEVQRAERTKGTIPAGIDHILKSITKHEIRWQEVLAQFVTSCYNGKRRWLPPARRHVYNGIYLQSRRNEKIKVTVAIDTSGSCVQDLPKFFGELNGLLTSFGEYELNLIQCDAEVDSFERYDSGNPFVINDANDIKWSGGGGTSFKPPFEYVRKNGIEQDCFIYFTDGYGDAPRYAPPYPVLWILTADGSQDFCEWGRKLKFNSTSY